MSFEYISSILILISYYIQSKNVYGNLFQPKFNKEILEHQLTYLAKSLDYKYIFWMFQYTVFAITIVTLIFKPINGFIVFLTFMAFILFIQYLLEKHFLFKFLAKYAKENLSIKQLLNNLESTTVLVKTNLNQAQYSQIEYVKETIEKGYYDKSLIASFILGKNSSREWKKDDYFVNIYNDKGELLKLDLKTFEIFKVKERASSYLNHLYDVYTFEKVYLYGLIEPLVLSLTIILGGMK